MVLLIDNYDSFTYNLYQFLCELGADVTVVRNDAVTLDEIEAMAPERIVISPGPRTPAEAGISTDVVRRFGPTVPTLGVCLGHQCIGAAYGASVAGAGEIMHGKMSTVHHDGQGVFAGLPEPLETIRYHSLAIVPETVPPDLEVTARTDSGVIMGVRHRTYPVEGIQFHPESIMTQAGKELLANFLESPAGGRGEGTRPFGRPGRPQGDRESAGGRGEGTRPFGRPGRPQGDGESAGGRGDRDRAGGSGGQR